MVDFFFRSIPEQTSSNPVLTHYRSRHQNSYTFHQLPILFATLYPKNAFCGINSTKTSRFWCLNLPNFWSTNKLKDQTNVEVSRFCTPAAFQSAINCGIYNTPPVPHNRLVDGKGKSSNRNRLESSRRERQKSSTTSRVSASAIIYELHLGAISINSRRRRKNVRVAGR